MHRILQAFVRDHQPALQTHLGQFRASQQCATILRFLPDPAVTLASRGFASGSDGDPPSEEAAASAPEQTVSASEPSAEANDGPAEETPEAGPLAAADQAKLDAVDTAKTAEASGAEAPRFTARGPGGLDFHAEAASRGYTAWDEVELDEEVAQKVKERGNRKVTRELMGSYVDNEDLMDEMDAISPQIPGSLPIYNIDELIPWATQPESQSMEAMQWLQENAPDLAELCLDHGEAEAPFPGARPILRWSMTAVLGMNHAEMPADKNKKTKCRVYLRDLQQQARPPLTLDALHHIAAIAGPRYNPNKGELTLTSEKYPHREANRNHIMQMLHDLVAEGHRLMGVSGVPLDSKEPVQPVPQDPAPSPQPPPKQVFHMRQHGATVAWMHQ